MPALGCKAAPIKPLHFSLTSHEYGLPARPTLPVGSTRNAGVARSHLMLSGCSSKLGSKSQSALFSIFLQAHNAWPMSPNPRKTV